MHIDPEFESILKNWGSERAIYEFLKKEFDRMNRAAFGGCLKVPTLRFTADEGNSNGDYQAADRHWPAAIGIYAGALTNQDKARQVLAHYMVHHWENTVPPTKTAKIIPPLRMKKSQKAFRRDIVNA